MSIKLAPWLKPTIFKETPNSQSFNWLLTKNRTEKSKHENAIREACLQENPN